MNTNNEQQTPERTTHIQPVEIETRTPPEILQKHNLHRIRAQHMGTSIFGTPITEIIVEFEDKHDPRFINCFQTDYDNKHIVIILLQDSEGYTEIPVEFADAERAQAILGGLHFDKAYINEELHTLILEQQKPEPPYIQPVEIETRTAPEILQKHNLQRIWAYHMGTSILGTPITNIIMKLEDKHDPRVINCFRADCDNKNIVIILLQDNEGYTEIPVEFADAERAQAILRGHHHYQAYIKEEAYILVF